MSNNTKRMLLNVEEFEFLTSELRRVDKELQAAGTNVKTMVDFLQAKGLWTEFTFFKLAIDSLGVTSSELAKAMIHG